MSLLINRPTTADIQEIAQHLDVEPIDVTTTQTNEKAGFDYQPELQLFNITEEKEKNYCCEACGNRFSQLSSLKRYKKYNCKNLETEKTLKERCPGCYKMLNKTTVYKHEKNGCPKPKH